MFNIKYPLSPPEISSRNGHKRQVINSGAFFITEHACVMSGPGRGVMCSPGGGKTTRLGMDCFAASVAPGCCHCSSSVCPGYPAAKSSCGRALTGSTVEPTAMASKLCLQSTEVRGCDPGVLGGVMSNWSSSLRLSYAWGWVIHLIFFGEKKSLKNPTACLRI